MPDKAIRRMPSSVAKPPSKRPQQRVQGLARLHRLVVVAVQVDEQHPAGRPARSDQRKARVRLACASAEASPAGVIDRSPVARSSGNARCSSSEQVAHHLCDNAAPGSGGR